MMKICLIVLKQKEEYSLLIESCSITGLFIRNRWSFGKDLYIPKEAEQGIFKSNSENFSDRVSQRNCAPFVLLLWRSCRLNYLDFTQLRRLCFNLEFETLFESI